MKLNIKSKLKPKTILILIMLLGINIPILIAGITHPNAVNNVSKAYITPINKTANNETNTDEVNSNYPMVNFIHMVTHSETVGIVILLIIMVVFLSMFFLAICG